MKHVPSANIEAQLFGLSTLVQLVKRARHAATARELAFIMVNETHSLLPYRQAVLWRHTGKGRGRIVAISGASVVERHAPLTTWLKRVLRKLDKEASDARPVGAADLPSRLGEGWAEWMAPHGF